MANESILISDVIAAAPSRIFSAWLDSAEHSAFTGSRATILPGLGGMHSAFDGYIQGRTLELLDGARIVQSWRTSEFPADSPDSRLEITLEPTLGGTLVTLLHTDIPSGQSDRYRSGWNEFYLSRMKAYFAERAAPEQTPAAPAPAPARKATPEKRSVKQPAPKKAPAPARKASKTGKASTPRKARKPGKASKSTMRSTKVGARKTKKPVAVKKSSRAHAGRRKIKAKSKK